MGDGVSCQGCVFVADEADSMARMYMSSRKDEPRSDIARLLRGMGESAT
jgi:hypothetical protein